MNINTKEYWDNVWENKFANSFYKYQDAKLEDVKYDIIIDWIKNKTIDMGCGSGRLCFRALKKGKDIYGLDFSNEIIRKNNNFSISNKYGKRFFVGEIKKNIFEDNSFDTVICCEVLEHVSDLDFAIKSLLRLAKSKGRIIISVPFRDAIISNEHVRIFDRSDLWQLFNPFAIEPIEVLILDNFKKKHYQYLFKFDLKKE